MANIISTGSCGDNATYNLYDDGLLEILGTGAMTDYAYSTSTYTTTAPWANYRYSNPIKTITIADGITTMLVLLMQLLSLKTKKTALKR